MADPLPAGQVPTPADNIPDGQRELQAMAVAGKTPTEIQAFKNQETGRLAAAGFHPDEIARNWGDAPPLAPATRTAIGAHVANNAGPGAVDFSGLLRDPLKFAGAAFNAEYNALAPYTKFENDRANAAWQGVADEFKLGGAAPATSIGGEEVTGGDLDALSHTAAGVLGLQGAVIQSAWAKTFGPLFDAGPGKDLAALTANAPHGEWAHPIGIPGVPSLTSTGYDFRMPSTFVGDTVMMVGGSMAGGDAALHPSPTSAAFRAAAADGTHLGELSGPAEAVDHVVPPGTTANVNIKSYMPDGDAFTHAATDIIGHGLNTEALRRVSSNLYHVWVNTGLLPDEAVARAKVDGAFREELFNQHTDGTPSIAHYNSVRRPDPKPYRDPTTATTVDPRGKEIPVYAHNVDEALPIFAKLEMSGDRALGPVTAANKGERAVGKYQIEPYTARQYMGANFDVSTLTDPKVNAAVARVVLTDLYNKTNGNLEAMAIAYDGGPERLHTWQNNGPGTRLEATLDPNMRSGWRYTKVTADRDESNLPTETQQYVARARFHMGNTGEGAPTPKTAGERYEATTDFIKALGPGFRDTGDYRSMAREDQLRAQGAGTVRPGQVSSHSRGTPEAPGGHDVVPTNGDFEGALKRVKEMPGVDPAHTFIEGGAGGQGEHIHVTMLAEAAAAGEVVKADPETLPRVLGDGAGTTADPETGELQPYEFPPERETPEGATITVDGKEMTAQEAHEYAISQKVDPQTGEMPASSIDRSGGAADAWNDDRPHGDAYEEMWSNVGDQRDLPDAPGMHLYDKIVFHLFNELQAAEAVDRELQAAGKQKDGDYTIRAAIAQTHAAGVRAQLAAVAGPVRYDPNKMGEGKPGWTVDADGPSMWKALGEARKTGRSVQDFVAWLMARRTVVLKHNHGLDNGHNLPAAEHIMRIDEDRALFQPAADIWDGWNQGVIHNAVIGRGDGKGSILPPAAESKLNNMAWVSGRKLRGDADVPPTPNAGMGSTALYRMTGKDGKVLDPVMSSADNNRMIQQSVEVNMARQELVEAAKASPELAAAAGIVKVNAKPTEVGLDSIRAELSKMGVPDDQLDDAAELYGHFIQERQDALLKPGQFPVYYNGVRELWQTSWPELLQLIDGSSAKQVQFLNKTVPAIIRAPFQWGAKGIQFGVEMLPSFVANTFGGHQLIQWLNNKESPPPLLTGLSKLLDVAKMSPLLVDAMANGALGSSLASMDHDARYDALNGTMPTTGTFSRVRNAVANWKDTPNLKTSTVAVANALTSPLLIGKWAIEKTNASNRTALYSQGLARGESPLLAGAKAAEMGIDYTAGPGNGFIRWWTTMVPFMRPALLYTDNFLLGMRRNPARMSTKAFAAITLPKTALFFINTAQDQIPPGQPGYVPEADKYRNVPLWERYYYFHSPYINGGRAKLRMPAGAGYPFGAVPEIVLQAMHDHDPAEFTRLGQAFIEEYAPDSFLPPVAKAAGEQLTGRNFDTFGPMIPGSLAGSLPELQYTPNSSIVARKISGIIGPPTFKLTGNPNLTIDTPIGLDRLMKSLSGTGGARALSGLDIDPAGKHDWAGADNPFWGNFVARHPGIGGQEVQDFYDEKTSWDAYAASKGVIKREIAGGDASNIGMVPEVWDKAAVDAQMTRVAKQLAQYREQITRISRDTTQSPEERSQHVDDLASQMTALAHVATRTMRAQQGKSNPEEGQVNPDQSLVPEPQ